MGWNGLYDKPFSIPEYFRSRWENEKTKCLGQAFVGRFTLYGVWERTRDDGTVFQFATVVLIRYGGRGDDCAWYYKDMDETVGPCESTMPKTLLKKLKTPAYNDWARAWRKRCWQNALGLTKHSVIIKARRLWKRAHLDAIQLLEDWNAKHPDDKIRYSF